MKLKSLEISGFKSFADKTMIELMPGMTGIIDLTVQENQTSLKRFNG